MTEACFWVFCFVPIDPSSKIGIFGFSEFLAAIALLVVVYTITDIRYKFRIAVTPSSLYVTTFVLIAIIGLQTLLTEIWIVEGWWVPRTSFLSQSIWQGIFGMLFLSIFITWMYFAYISPPVFGKRNARRFTQELYRYILRGNDRELKTIADELARSAKPLIGLCRINQNEHSKETSSKQKSVTWKPEAKDYAYDVLLLIANRRFCRLIVSSSPVTAQAFFTEVISERKFNIPFGPFARNISSEAVAQKDSFLYVESEGYYSGLMGLLKPVSTSVYGSYELAHALGQGAASTFYIDYKEKWSWDAQQWEAYCRAVLIMIESFLSSKYASNHSSVVYSALGDIEGSFRDLYKLNDSPTPFENDISDRLGVATNFLKNIIELVDKASNPPHHNVRIRSETYPKNIYDYVATQIYKLCFAASMVNSSPDICWEIHHNTVWCRFFGLGSGNGPAHKIIQFKVRRLLFDEISELSRLPNYKGSRILGFCLNVLGMKTGPKSKESHRDTFALTKAVECWTQNNYLTLRSQNPEVAKSVLIGRLTFDEPNSRLVTTYIRGLSSEAPKTYLDLKPTDINHREID